MRVLQPHRRGPLRRAVHCLGALCTGCPTGAARPRVVAVLQARPDDQAVGEGVGRYGYGSAIATVLFFIMLIYISYFLYRMYRDERDAR